MVGLNGRYQLYNIGVHTVAALCVFSLPHARCRAAAYFTSSVALRSAQHSVGAHEWQGSIVSACTPAKLRSCSL